VRGIPSPFLGRGIAPPQTHLMGRGHPCPYPTFLGASFLVLYMIRPLF